MRKLNKKKVCWILRWKQKGVSTKELAISQKVSRRRIQQIWKQYANTGQIVLKRPGRRRKVVELDMIKLILNEHPHNSGACVLERKLFAKHKIRIPHNTIHMVLKHAGYAKDEPNKHKRRRPWVRFERKHSLSLVQTDWHESKAVPGKQLITFLDDASRKILSIEEHDNATTENTIKTFRRAANENKAYGGIVSILSDHGTQFQKEFNKELDAYGIRHIYSRVKHPQIAGKMERFHQTYNKHRARFKTLDEFREWYNEERMHMSLNMRYAETPSQAFIRKMRQEVWLGKVKEWFD